jgi:hypothetical protein
MCQHEYLVLSNLEVFEILNRGTRRIENEIIMRELNNYDC